MTDSFIDLGIINLDSSYIWVLLVLLFFFLVIIAINLVRFFVRRSTVNNSYFEHQIFLVKLPKEKPKDNEIGFNVQQMKEEIAKGETIFASIGGLRAEKGFKSWLYGRQDHFSFEVVANQNKIAFYVATPKESARYVEQQIHAHYPEASIEEIEDYNSFSPDSQVAAGYLKTKKAFFFPIKTYQKMEVDPMNSIINVMSKLSKD